MMLFLKKKFDDRSEKTPLSASAKPRFLDFIPYYAHFNPHTLVTKNGELMQIIKIASNLSDLDYENGIDAAHIAREVIRRSVLECVSTDRVALWMHTIRKRRPIRNRGTFKETFANAVHDRWQQIHRWKYQYYNEIYISVLYDGQSSNLMDSANLRHIILPGSNREFRNAYLDVAYEELDGIVTAMMAKIQENFKAQRLSVVERVPPQTEIPINQALFYSEPMEFLGTILNLRSESFLLPDLDISDALCTTAQTFGFNAVETKNPEGKRRFSGLLTLKQYREVPAETADRLLQAPMEFIITQAFHFIPPTGALKQYREQKHLLDISGDTYCMQASGIEDMMASQTERLTDFGQHQTSIMVVADEFKQLDAEIMKIQQAFAELGLITIREDIKLEECFWAQLPGNFEFLRRKDTINTARIGGFTRLNRFPNGIATGNHWGDAVTVLPTLVNSPYFFNFHHQDNGHTAVFDFNSFSDQITPILMNFLLTEARKFGGKLFIFDRHKSAKLLFSKLGGDYHYFTALTPPLTREEGEPQMRLNPFTLPPTPRNKGFLLAWLAALIGSPQLPEAQKEIMRSAIEQLYVNEASARNLSGFIGLIAARDPALAKQFSSWHGGGAYGGIFDAVEEDIDLTHFMHAFDLTPALPHKECLLPVFTYLLHRIVTEVDGRPAIIVLYNAWELIENPFIAPRLDSLLEMLQQNNVMVIFTTGRPGQVTGQRTFPAVMKHCATRLYIPDDIGRNYVSPELGLTENDAALLFKMDRQKGHFLLKQNNETIALAADIRDMDDIHAVFANDIKNLTAALGKFAQKTTGEGE